MSSDATGPSFSAGAGGSEDDLGTGDDLSTVSATTDDSCFSFDRNGVIIPYFAFVSLMDDENFQSYLRKVVEKFEETEGSLSRLFQVEELRRADGVEEEEEEEEEVVGPRRKKRTSKGPIQYVDDDNDDDDDDDEVDGADSASLKRKRPPTPMAGINFEPQLQNPSDLSISLDALVVPPVKKTAGRKAQSKK